MRPVQAIQAECRGIQFSWTSSFDERACIPSPKDLMKIVHAETLDVSMTSKRHLDESLFPLLVPEESVNSAQHTVFGQPGLPHIAEAPVELRTRSPTWAGLKR